MDPKTNPYAPGAGTQPPELAGRSEILTAAEVALARILAGRAARGQMLLGLRGVGKTVLLNRIRNIAKAEGFKTVLIEAAAERPLASLLVHPLGQILRELDTGERVRGHAKAALRTLRSFASTFKVTVGGVEVGVEAEASRASGNLETDLPDLLTDVATAAQAGGTGVALLIDEVQYLKAEDLTALITALHRITQEGLPLIFFGGGLPQLAAMAGEAKSYAERLLSYPAIGPLAEDAAARAIREPAARLGVEFTSDALAAILQLTRGYPYFLQEWGFHTWHAARTSPVTLADVARATADTQHALDEGFFKVRLDRCTEAEKIYLRAMAELGDGTHTTTKIASVIGKDSGRVATSRARLIKKGMIYSPRYGLAAFTVPLFDEFMKRTIPDWTPDAS